MQKKKRLRPALPKFIPGTEDKQIIWLTNYKTNLPILALQYGIPKPLVDAALLAIDALIPMLKSLKVAREIWEAWLDCGEELQYDKPSDPDALIKWPVAPTWEVMPAPIKLNAWKPILATTKLFIAMTNLTAQDRTTLGLNKYVSANKRPVPTGPVLKLSLEGNTVFVHTSRNVKYTGLLAKYVIDYNNNGQFVHLKDSVDSKFPIPVVFPEGVTVMTWTLQAIFMDLSNEVYQWSKAVSITLYKNGPVMGTSPVAVNSPAVASPAVDSPAVDSKQ